MQIRAGDRVLVLGLERALAGVERAFNAPE
jgi:hypothetical protein